MVSSKLIFSAVILAFIFGNVYAGKYTIENIILLIYTSYMNVNHFIMYVVVL